MVKMLSSKNVSEEIKLNPVIFLKESIDAFHSSWKINTFMWKGPLFFTNELYEESDFKFQSCGCLKR